MVRFLAANRPFPERFDIAVERKSLASMVTGPGRLAAMLARIHHTPWRASTKLTPRKRKAALFSDAGSETDHSAPPPPSKTTKLERDAAWCAAQLIPEAELEAARADVQTVESQLAAHQQQVRDDEIRMRDAYVSIEKQKALHDAAGFLASIMAAAHKVTTTGNETTVPGADGDTASTVRGVHRAELAVVANKISDTASLMPIGAGFHPLSPQDSQMQLFMVSRHAYMQQKRWLNNKKG
ncbi:hypothetical protein ColKHC_06636 [Colletotrichum higginsianum]|nr:hypothetical protein ColKHC_06636 [Colletotrichum higginsianum]